MAKVKKSENKDVEIVSEGGVKLVSPELEVKLTSNLTKKAKQEESVDFGEVQVVAEEPKVVPTKMVRVLMASDHKCFIGGEWYYLLRDKYYNVPENVKAVLMRANKLKPL